MKILLASKSPRRRELLAGLDIPYSIVDIESDETYPSYLREGDIPLYIARLKSHAYSAPLLQDEVLLTADTIVWIEGEVLGKPKDEKDACRMLKRLSGNTHQVYTGVCLRTKDEERAFVSRSDVTFRQLSDDDILHYVKKYRPLDKAGAYGVQEWIGYVGCVSLKGSFYNVMGLPTAALYEALSELRG